MTNKTILDAVHETAKGLHKAGAMDATTMREFDALCLPPVKYYSAGQIKKLRLRYKASQAVFAAYLNTSPSTVQKWEQGKKTTERSIVEAAQYRGSERSRRAWLTRARQAGWRRYVLTESPLLMAELTNFDELQGQSRVPDQLSDINVHGDSEARFERADESRDCPSRFR